MGRFNTDFINANKVNPHEKEDEKNIEEASEIGEEKQIRGTDEPREVFDSADKVNINVSSDIEGDGNSTDVNSPVGKDVKTYEKLDVNLIEFASDNPFRKKDSSESGKRQLEELANNIAVFGLTTPLLVNKINNKYILISGERRLQAVKMLGWETVDCMVTEVTNQHMSQGMLFSANVLTRQISTFEMFSYIYELSDIYSALVKDGTVSGGKYRYISDCLNMSKRQLVKYTSIMNNINLLTEEEKRDLESGELSVNKAYSLVKSRKASVSSQTSPEAEPIDSVKKDNMQSEASVTPDDEIDNIGVSDNDKLATLKLDGAEDNTDFPAEEEPKEEPEEEKPNSNDNSEVNFEQAETNSFTQPEDTKLLSGEINQSFIDCIINNDYSGISMYEGESLSMNKEIYGALVCSGLRRFIVFPSSISSKANEDNTILKASFKCFEVDPDSVRKKEG